VQAELAYSVLLAAVSDVEKISGLSARTIDVRVKESEKMALLVFAEVWMV
jgi:hypothetical protein